MYAQGKAYEENGRKWLAKDVGIKERACAWMQHGFMSVNSKSGAGRAFLRSLYQQYADWGVDFGIFKIYCYEKEDYRSSIPSVSLLSEMHIPARPNLVSKLLFVNSEA